MGSKKIPSRRATIPSRRATATATADGHDEKNRQKLGNDNNMVRTVTSTVDADANSAFEERLKDKLTRDNNNRPKHPSASLPIDSSSRGDSESAVDAYEAKVRRKLARERKVKHLSSSMPEASMNRINSEYNLKSGKNFSELQEYNCEDETIEQETYFDASSVCFDDLFADLQKFKQENGSLTIPVSHPSFLCIIDNLSSAGFEELLKKRWDSQFAGLKAFKREHGDCLIPATHPTLGRWIMGQRNHFKLHEQRLPSSITKKRFNKMKDVGLDEFVNWKETRKTPINEKNGPPSVPAAASVARKEHIMTSAPRTAVVGEAKPVCSHVHLDNSRGNKNPHALASVSETTEFSPPQNIETSRGNTAHALMSPSESSTTSSSPFKSSFISDNLTLDQKIQMKKKSNNIKFVERGLRAHSSSEKKLNKEAVAAEMHKKRMLQRSVQRGAGRAMLKKMITEAMEMGDYMESDDKGVPKSTKESESYSYMMRSCSASNLCPGSWECSNCTYINEPVGLDPCNFCKRCNASKDQCTVFNKRKQLSKNEASLKLVDGLPPPASRATTIDEMNEASFVLGDDQHITGRSRNPFALAFLAPRATTKDDLNIDSWSELFKPSQRAPTKDDLNLESWSELFRSASSATTKDDINLESWSELSNPLAVAAMRSVADVNLRQSHKEEVRKLARQVNTERRRASSEF